MRALRLMNWKSEPELVEVPKPIPDHGQVVIRIGGAGACHSDLHLMHDFAPGTLPFAVPFTLGHENAGWVDSVGTGVRHVKEGDAVAVYGPWGCGACPRCQLGMETYCENPAGSYAPGGGGGLGVDGGMADYMLVPAERFLVKLPVGLTPEIAAPLTDAGLTPYHAVRRSWSKMTPDATVVIIGVGGLGHMAVQIVKTTTSAQVIAVDAKDDARQLATKVGADHVLTSDATTADKIKELTGGRGADVVLDFVGAETTIRQAMAAARVLGDVTIVGIAGNRFINQTLNVLQDVMKMSMETTLRLPGRSEISKNEHNAILSAIEGGDGDLASKLTLEHITGARNTAISDAKSREER